MVPDSRDYVSKKAKVIEVLGDPVLPVSKIWQRVDGPLHLLQAVPIVGERKHRPSSL
jgi:hypothetical protein